MSREYKIVEIPVRKEKRQIAVICDLCGHKTHQMHDGNASWDESPYKINVVKISRVQGTKQSTSYPEGINGEVIEWDICPVCFDKKIMPILSTFSSFPPPVTDEDD